MSFSTIIYIHLTLEASRGPFSVLRTVFGPLTSSQLMSSIFICFTSEYLRWIKRCCTINLTLIPLKSVKWLQRSKIAKNEKMST